VPSGGSRTSTRRCTSGGSACRGQSEVDGEADGDAEVDGDGDGLGLGDGDSDGVGDAVGDGVTDDGVADGSADDEGVADADGDVAGAGCALPPPVVGVVTGSTVPAGVDGSSVSIGTVGAVPGCVGAVPFPGLGRQHPAAPPTARWSDRCG
jgi:hypothetical protein